MTGFRKVISLTSLMAGMAALTGCGDGGGTAVSSVSSTPAATNTSLASLRASQSFANNAATATAALNLTTSQTLSSSTLTAPLTIQYDAASNSYTVATQGRSQTFAATDVTSSASGQNVYAKSDGTNSDHLTLQAASFTGASTTGPQYVGLGFWQRNTVSGNTQNTTLDIFTYGLATPAGAVPRTGQAAYTTNVFGLLTVPGVNVLTSQGTGRFDINFQSGQFTTSATLPEFGVVSGSNTGAGTLTGVGTLSSSAGTFSGTASYNGSGLTKYGTINGQFYGPTGQELGAVISASGSDGSAISAAMVGVQNASLTPVNLTLSQPVADQIFYTQNVLLTKTPDTIDPLAAYTSTLTGNLTQYVSGNVTITPGLSSLPNSTFSAADKVTSSDANFTSYQQTTGNRTVSLDLYKTGSANTELALTYLSFARWSASEPQPSTLDGAKLYFVYGLNSSAAAILARTGTAHYSGVAYGSAINTATAAAYNVTGTSVFDVNFGQSTYTGSLALKGSGTAGSADFGSLAFASTLSNGTAAAASLTQGGANVGTLTPGFYGPAGQEIGGAFQAALATGQAGKSVTIAGVAVAKGG